MLHGALAAAVTPLRDAGAALDGEAVAPYTDFLAGGGVDGILVLGTTGEGILLRVDERRRVLESFLGANSGRLLVAAHCGAQTTADTVALAAHAAEAGADAVAVIAPPYFRLDDAALLAHLAAAARACAPLPFYAYELEAVSGYAVPPDVLDELRERVDNVAGIKVSDTPFARVRPYLLEGVDVFVGAEALIHEGLAAGAAGAVSGLASAFPNVVAAVVRSPSPEGAAHVGELRATVERFPRHAALKHVIRRKGIAIREDVRAPLRALTNDERRELDGWLDSL